MPPDSGHKNRINYESNQQDMQLSYDHNNAKMVVKFPEAYAQYEYVHDSKDFVKVAASPRTGGDSGYDGGDKIFRHVVP